MHRSASPSDAPSIAAAMAGGDGALIDGFFLAGFECSEHRLECGRRLDLARATRHDELADADYARLRALGIAACREGVSWLRGEPTPRAWDFTALERRVASARRHRLRVAWDLMHFGWPDDLDIFAPSFPTRFGRWAGAVARWFHDHAPAEPDGHWFTPINEISFLAWAGGDVRVMNPFAAARGVELKSQLVLASIEAIEAVRAVLPGARFLQPEPVIHIHADPDKPKTWRRVESDGLLQFQAWDMLAGRVWPRLGGDERYLDVIGVNYYPDNQFTLDGETVRRGDPRYRPFAELLGAVHARYGRPMIVSETGAEGDARAPWLRYVADECADALRAGVELHGVTLYPIVNHPGWVDDRHCENGLWDYAHDDGARSVHAPLADEVVRQASRLAAERAAMLERRRDVRLTA